MFSLAIIVFTNALTLSQSLQTFPPVQLPPQKIELVDTTYCSCVTYLRSLGVDVPLIDAKWMQTFVKSVPTVGSVVLMSYGNAVEKNHVALVTSLGEDYFTVKEANYTPCKQGERVVKFSDKAIVGFWKPPQN